MKIVILSGGPGKRVWPLSDTSTPKQYSRVLDGPEGQPESMIQRLWRQLGAADLIDYASIATCGEHGALLKDQLGSHVPLHIEPAQRGNYNAVLLAAASFYSKSGVSPNETIVILPVDMYVEGDFFYCIRSLPKLLRESEASLMMIGTIAEHPGTRYGYIVPEQAEQMERAIGYDRGVQLFFEKPTKTEAEELVKNGALWNSGVYACELGFLMNRLLEAKLPTDYEELYKHYYSLPKQNLEEGLICDSSVSKAVIPYDGTWVNLSNWQTFSGRIALP